MSETPVTRLLIAHALSTTPELLTCACGWYVRRGDGATRAHAEHVAEALEVDAK